MDRTTDDSASLQKKTNEHPLLPESNGPKQLRDRGFVVGCLCGTTHDLEYTDSFGIDVLDPNGCLINLFIDQVDLKISESESRERQNHALRK